MATMAHSGRPHVGSWERTHVPRSKGAGAGTALVLLGLWGGLIPFVGPLFGYDFTPAVAWTWTPGRFWLEVLPAVAVVVGGLCLLGSGNRVVGLFGGWLAALGGAWFVVGRPVSTLWTQSGAPAGGVAGGTGDLHVLVEQLGFFSGLGVVVVFAAALALGRLSVIGVRDLRPAPAADREVTGDDTLREHES